MRSVQRLLDVQDAAADDVVDLPAGRGGERGAGAGVVGGADGGLVLVEQAVAQRVLAAGDAGAELELQDVAGLVAGAQQAVEVVLGVGGGDAEAGARGDERGGRVADDDDGDLAPQHLVREGGDLGRVVEQQRDDGRVVVPVDDEAEPLEAEAQVARVERQPLQPLLALARRQVAADDLQRARDLREHGRGRGLAVDGAGVGDADLVDDGLAGGDVAAVGAEGFREGAHQDVHLAGADAEVVAHSTAARSERPDAVCFVDVQRKLVLLLERHESRQVAHGAFHAVQPLHGHQDLAPGPMGPRLALTDAFAQHAFQVGHVVVLEHVDHRIRQPRAIPDGRMVELVADHQTALPHQRGKDRRVGHEAHAVDGGGFFTDELGDLLLHIDMQLAGADISSARAEGDTILADAQFRSIGAFTLGLREPEVVIRGHVQRLGRRAGQLERQVEVVALSIEQRDEPTGHARDRPPEDVVDAQLQSPDVEVIEITVEWRISITLLQMLVALASESLAEEISHVSEDDEDEVGDVGGDEVKVRGLVLDGLGELLAHEARRV
nr:hypothetical protein CFP56_03104 [Quercus suber]